MLAYFRFIAGASGLAVTALFVQVHAQEGTQVAREADVWTVFFGFIVGVVALGVYIARDAIFRKKTDYDRGEYGSKKDRSHEKYRSDWQDDYVTESAQTEHTKSHYDTLGIGRTATAAEIKLRYRELAKMHHPDRTGTESEDLVRINEAYEVLSDTESRRKYDSTLP